ncbi:trimeric intracellular cation channel family protein [Jatrophihabitans fulvus]
MVLAVSAQETSSTALTDVFRAIDLTGVFANAVLGGVIARALRLDPVGFAIIALLSGLGGGLIRDTLLQRGTPIALTDYAYVLTALGGAAVAFAVSVEGRTWNRTFAVVDAVAVGCWAAAGSQKTLAVGLGWLPAILLGTITAVGGGLVRDVVLQRIPAIFGGNTLYASCAVLASAVMVGFWSADLAPIGLVVSTLVGAVLVLGARRRGWSLPEPYSWRPRRPQPRRRDRP